jgi:dTDP-4-amino-4,6-dideoxygalactose transaminase
MKIKFFKPYITGNEIKYINDILTRHLPISGDGVYTGKVHEFLQKQYHFRHPLLTTSGTTALEMAVRLMGLHPEDEVIAPSFTFSSTINALLLNGLRVRFAEIQSDTLNIDPADIARKITKKTKAVMVVHYAGVACDMGAIMKLASKHKLQVIEDAAQAIDAKYKNVYLGTIGNFGAISFHETKNIVMGEGGVLLINSSDKRLIEQSEIIREKGTNRSKFFRGQIDKYTWVDIGSSCLPSDFLAAFLMAQLEAVKKITRLRHSIYNYYREKLAQYAKKGDIQLSTIPSFATHNAHMFYVLFHSQKDRDFILHFLNDRGVNATFHYIPLHSSPQGRSMGYRTGDFPITERVSSTLIRLPLWAGMGQKETKYVVDSLKKGLEALAGTH